MLYGVMVISALFTMVILYLLAAYPSEKKLFGWFLLDSAVWCAGFFWIDTPVRWIYLSIPFIMPLSGPILVCMGCLVFQISRQQNYLSDDPTLNTIFHHPGKMTRLTYVSLEEILEEDRKIISAGDILKWGDVSLKQAVIDRLSLDGSSPRAIRVLKGAWNDPDEEVRFFATTVLTRLEKTYQERIRSLEGMSESEKSYSTIGKAYFDYAMSNLVGQKLSEVLILRGLSVYLHALKTNESFSVEELLLIGSQAIVKGNREVAKLVMDRILILGGEREIKFLEWMNLYQNGAFLELHADICRSRSLFEKSPLPDYLDLWVSDMPNTGVSNGK